MCGKSFHFILTLLLLYQTTRKIQILDELNKTNMQRHALKYQELVEEYNSLADEFEAKEDEMQNKLDALLAANDSGSVAKYNELIRGMETQLKVLNARIAELEAGKQEWKKQVGHMAEARIAQLEKETVELREENSRLRSVMVNERGFSYCSQIRI